jgi:hypothetical protein
MLRISLLVAVIIFIGLSPDIYAQDASQKARDLTAALDKTKYKKKEKANISIEIYIDIKNEAAVRENVFDYGGHYDADGYRLDLRVSKDGAVQGEGHDGGGDQARRGHFILRDARINGSLLTGTKVYDGGEALNFEGVFVNRTVTSGKNSNQIDSRQTMFGLGFIENNGSWTNRVFLERR